MRLVVTGTRDGRPDVWYWLDRWVRKYGVPELVILGGDEQRGKRTQRGVDLQAAAWAYARGYKTHVEWADWGRGAIAGPLRNQCMVNVAEVGDWCVALPGPVSKGTWDCHAKAERRGLWTAVCPLREAA